MFIRNLRLIVPLLIVSLLSNPQFDFEHISDRLATPAFKFERFSSPSKDDAATTARLTVVDGTPDGASADLSALIDGKLPANADDPGANFFFDAGTMGGRIRLEFPGALDV